MTDPFSPGRGALPPRAWQATSAPSISLGGRWAFRLRPRPDRGDAFADPGYDDAGWGELPVPAHWQLHGHGAPAYTSGSRLAHEFEAGGLLRPGGENVLAVRVTQWSAGSYLEDQDMWWLSGLFRSVELLARPPGCVGGIPRDPRRWNSFT